MLSLMFFFCMFFTCFRFFYTATECTNGHAPTHAHTHTHSNNNLAIQPSQPIVFSPSLYPSLLFPQAWIPPSISTPTEPVPRLISPMPGYRSHQHSLRSHKHRAISINHQRSAVRTHTHLQPHLAPPPLQRKK